MASNTKKLDLAKKPAKSVSLPLKVTREDAAKFQEIAIARGTDRTGLLRSLVVDFLNNTEKRKLTDDLSRIEKVVTEEHESVVKLLTAMTGFLTKEVMPQLKELNEKVEQINQRDSI